MRQRRHQIAEIIEPHHRDLHLDKMRPPFSYTVEKYGPTITIWKPDHSWIVGILLVESTLGHVAVILLAIHALQAGRQCHARHWRGDYYRLRVNMAVLWWTIFYLLSAKLSSSCVYLNDWVSYRAS
ncbi:hypothetical protein QBC35DRAFT_510607 [Podospora australis]|uniref:Uncharacterized protein n=1 Tax=Podospora australis TaxID=1536484 RepID=A0AAN7AB41_9PEZI|nr:hypothetical protein QBC35DRAFT_510607 [Podospora australis]